MHISDIDRAINIYENSKHYKCTTHSSVICTKTFPVSYI